MVAPVGLGICASGGAGSAVHAQNQVDLQLVLAVDASGSVNDARFQLQKLGYVAAFRNLRVQTAIRSGMAGGIAVTMMQWTGPSLQVHAVPWSFVGDTASVEAFARVLEQMPRHLFSGGTSISGAIDKGVQLLEACPFRGGRSVIDISGDGANNRGRSASDARDEAVAKGITINGLPILSIEPFLDQHYKSEVIGGVNAFMVVAASYEEFADAIIKKLIAEIASGQGEASGATA